MFFVLTVFPSFGGGDSQRAPVPKPETPPEERPEFLERFPPELLAHEDLPADLSEGEDVSAAGETAAVPPAQPARQGPYTAEQVMKALAAAYPDRVGPAEFRQTSPTDPGDWAVQLRGVWFYFAGGRMLTEELRSQFDAWDPQPFYSYAAELPPWKAPSAEDSQRIREREKRRLGNPSKRFQGFYDSLYRAHNKDEAYSRIKSIRFMGKPVLVHYSILEELSLVEERLQEEVKTNSQVRDWVKSIDTQTGWNWREIAATASRSFHAYGAAVDFLPKSTGKLATYWLWSSEFTSDWWTIPYAKRYHPPQAVVKAFEANGFIWGGKWFQFDTMHFEYRPEILILNNIPISDIR